MRQSKSYILALLIGGIVVFCFLSVCYIEQGQQDVIIYSSMESFRNEKMKEMLEQEFPDINIVIQYISTTKGAAKIKLEGQYTDADILVGLDIQSMELIKELFVDLSAYEDEHYIEGINPVHNKYKIWEKFAGAIIINNGVIERLDLPIPRTYDDLLKPCYKELIAMPDPKSSGTGYFYLKNRVNALGEEEALAYFDDLYPNIKQFTQSGSGPVKLLLQEETAIGLGMTFQAVGEINKGKNLTIIYPPEGSPYSLTGIAMIDKGKENKQVIEIFEYLYDTFILYDKEHYSPEMIFKNQVNTMENYPQNIIYGDMTGIEDAEEKQRLLEKWRY